MYKHIKSEGSGTSVVSKNSGSEQTGNDNSAGGSIAGPPAIAQRRNSDLSQRSGDGIATPSSSANASYTDLDMSQVPSTTGVLQQDEGKRRIQTWRRDEEGRRAGSQKLQVIGDTGDAAELGGDDGFKQYTVNTAGELVPKARKASTTMAAAWRIVLRRHWAEFLLALLLVVGNVVAIGISLIPLIKQLVGLSFSNLKGNTDMQGRLTFVNNYMYYVTTVTNYVCNGIGVLLGIVLLSIVSAHWRTSFWRAKKTHLSVVEQWSSESRATVGSLWWLRKADAVMFRCWIINVVMLAASFGAAWLSASPLGDLSANLTWTMTSKLIECLYNATCASDQATVVINNFAVKLGVSFGVKVFIAIGLTCFVVFTAWFEMAAAVRETGTYRQTSILQMAAANHDSILEELTINECNATSAEILNDNPDLVIGFGAEKQYRVSGNHLSWRLGPAHTPVEGGVYAGKHSTKRRQLIGYDQGSFTGDNCKWKLE